VFGGRVVQPLPEAEMYELPSGPALGETDLESLGDQLGRTLS
jgi:hypothetical protein